MKILLITLVHNRKHLLGAALQSAANQTLPKDKWAHLIVDNASTDGADKIAEAFARKYTNVYLERMPKNLGQQPAYNWVLDEWLPKNMPDADVMCILDSDDELYQHALLEVNKMFSQHKEIGGAYSGFALIDAKGRFIVKNHGKAKMAKNQFTAEGQKQLRRMFVGANPCGHLRSYSIKCLRNIGGFDTEYKYATDYNIFGRLMTKHTVVKIDSVLYKFRQHGDQIQGKVSSEQTKCWKDLQKYFRDKWTKMGLI